MSAITKSFSPARTTPRLGCSVVNGYGAIFGRAADTAARNVDLPALGRPIRPMSAISFSRSQIHISWPTWPGLAWRGAWLDGPLKCALPKPPLPPFKSTTRWPGSVISASTVSWSSASTTVPGGTRSDDVVAALAGAVAAHAVLAGLGLEVLLVAEVDQRIEAVDAFEHDVAALAAVAAVGAAEFDEFLTPERDGTRPAVARADVDLALVEEFHGSVLASRRAQLKHECQGALFFQGWKPARDRLRLWLAYATTYIMISSPNLRLDPHLKSIAIEPITL